jgi:hypothetical protein
MLIALYQSVRSPPRIGDPPLLNSRPLGAKTLASGPAHAPYFNGDRAVTSFVVDTQNPTDVFNQDAFDLTGDGDSLLVTNAGSLLALDGGAGITASGSSETVTIYGLVYSSGGNGVVLTNAEDTVYEDGQVQGAVSGISAAGDALIYVNGTVQGGGAGVYLQGSSSSLVVDGQVQGSVSGITLNNASGATINIGRTGEVNGGGDGILSEFYNSAVITNDGHISGQNYGVYVYNSDANSILNNGILSSSESNGGGAAIAFSASTDGVVQNTGTISAQLAIYAAAGSTVAISNSGTVEGSLIVFDTSQVDLENTGAWQGPLEFNSNADNTLTNSGKIHGAITMGSGSGTLANTGTITGSISFAGSFDTLTNGGAIHGYVYMGVNDELTNTGTIHGSVVLGTGDTLDTSRGEITGSVGAATKDTFDFSGSFGHNTIDEFAWSGATHDVMHFASDDFANYAAVQAHMAQVGSDVVITLDAGDTIVLQSMTLAHLVSHDFTFG